MKDSAAADAMTVILTFNGSGYAEPTEADKQAMSLWAGEIYGRLKKYITTDSENSADFNPLNSFDPLF